MKEGLTELVFILDRSGSMSGLVSDTIGGFNSMFEKQKEVEGECKVTTILFDNLYEVLHERVDIKDIQPITNKEYWVRGNTALLDALGKAINDLGVVLHNTPDENRPEKVMFVIITDGYENASREFTKEKVKEMVEHQSNVYNWEFIFLGANIDAIDAAGQIGIVKSRVSNYVADAEGTNKNFEDMNEILYSYRMSKSKESSDELIRKKMLMMEEEHKIRVNKDKTPVVSDDNKTKTEKDDKKKGKKDNDNKASEDKIADKEKGKKKKGNDALPGFIKKYFA